MTQEDKKLLLKDLCARLPYGVKIEVVDNNDFSSIEELDCYYLNRVGDNFYSIKPYLLPLSSMTEEQEVEYNSYFEKIPYYDYNMHLPSYFLELLIDFYNKNHLDWRGLIPKRLAKDATGLNIY